MRTFIYGSCVSRDTFEYLPRAYTLSGYIARQSLISAYSPPAIHYRVPDVPSAFQRRMLEFDKNSLLPTLLREQANADIVLIDLTDERLGVYRLPEGAYITRTVELMKAGLDANLPPQAQHIPWGSREHYSLWMRALQAFATTLRQLDLQRKTLILAPKWATHTDAGEPTPASFGMHPNDGNKILKTYSEAIATVLRRPILRTGRFSPVRAATHHVWGVAPFHYTDSVYRELASRITRGA